MLTLADRVAYQRAIEEVYWQHRIWPKANAGVKPPLNKVMPRAEIERKVEDYLRNSQALSDYWQRPITPDQLQAEMERIASHTKQPGVLHELFAAMGNDPFVIAECLARPVLAERLVRDLTRSGESNAIDTLKSDPRTRLHSQSFAKQDDVSRISDAVLWTHESFRNWGEMRRHVAFVLYPSVRRISLDARDEAGATNLADGAYKLPEISVPLDCIDDTWAATTTVNGPDARAYHTAVWTGNEMIIWGGFNSSGDLDTGWRYNPSTDSWTATSTNLAPVGREFHTAVWTGSEMIVWGGLDTNGSVLNTGGRYNPSTDSWTATSTTNTPINRYLHTAVWTGSEMIIWGGYFYDGSSHYLNTGGRYNPSIDSWTATSTSGVPDGRYGHTAVWTGSQMIVWGGIGSSALLNTGGRYNPGTDSWTPTSTTSAPAVREWHTAVWAGSEMIVWGGENLSSSLNTGGRYNPSTDNWTATSTTGAPTGRRSHTAVWTGSEMIAWGGTQGTGVVIVLNTGGRYNPSIDSWTATSTTGAPASRVYQTAVWTGSQMVVWGGADSTSYFNTGGRYCAQPSTPVVQSVVSRKIHGAVGMFDVDLPLTGTPGIECRSGGATNDYTIVVTFLADVSVSGNPQAAVTSGIGTIGSGGVSNGGMVITSGNVVTIPLTNVANAQTINVTLNNVNGSTNVTIPMGVLIGDVNGNAVVNASDVSLTKSQAGVPVSGSNFREDVTANGTISATDVAQVKANVGTSLPP